MAAPSQASLLERDFAIEELFFSTTDLKGHIKAGNAVFARVSAYSEDELVGSAHNIIRHPDMPRAVFQLLWDYLEAGRPIAAYVKNRAKDGLPYWVMATVVPIPDGYLSVRLKPSSPYFAAVKPVYAELLALEQAIEKEGGPRRRAIEASTARLGELLQAAGFADYDAFMHAALPAEVRSREALRTDRGERAAAQPAPGAAVEPARADLADFLDSCRVLFAHLEEIFVNLDHYEELHEKLAGKSTFVVDLAHEIRLFALNAVIASARLDAGGATLGAVASLMRARSDATAGLAGGLSGDIEKAMSPLRDIAFMTSVTRLQTEMAMLFAEELLATEAGDGAAGDHTKRAEASVRALSYCLDRGTGPLLLHLDELAEHLGRVRGSVRGLARELDVLRALHMKGRIEATASSAGAEAFRVLLARIKEQISAAGVEMADFQEVAAASRTRAGGDTTVVQRHLSRIAERAAA